MEAYLGVDVGAVSVKAALILSTPEMVTVRPHAGTRAGWRWVTAADEGGQTALVAPAQRTRGRPLEVTATLIKELLSESGVSEVRGLALTGSGAKLVSAAGGLARCNEFQAIARAAWWLMPHIRTVFEIGGETSKFLHLEPEPGNGALQVKDYGTNGDCAAGTGGFLDQQASRLHYAVEAIGQVVAETGRSAQIAGRCSVFAKSDMIHAQQKGYSPAEVLGGLCKAVATNFKAAVVKGRRPVPPAAFIGGVSANAAVVRELAQAFGLEEGSFFVPPAADAVGAIGAALMAAEHPADDPLRMNALLDRLGEAAGRQGHVFPDLPPLSMERVTLLRDHVRPYTWPANGSRVDAYLGLDIGSVGTKLVLIDTHGQVIHFIFTRTDGRPVEVVGRSLRELEEAVGDRVRICGVGTTGSGRELIGELVGADTINDEITCHKTGAAFVGDRLLGRRPDTIFEIGGQDSKYISLEPESGGSTDTVVVDFTMNEACAAGTGSFLEERAEELGVAIKDEFARLALSSAAPIRLGERCTVFMERDVNTCMQRGARREDVIAGLAYSVVYNYINRVVRGRPIGDCIFFQGGTAYNDAVAAAFSAVTGKEIIVPPHNAVLGAIGAALLAREKMASASNGHATRYRGYDLAAVDYTLREFTCKGCANQCSIQEFNVEGEKTYWGDKCSDRYRKRAKTDRKPASPDLVALRRELLEADDDGDPADPIATIGVPMAMYTYDLLPLWRRFFRDCGFKVVASAATNRRTIRLGNDCIVAEPCFPLIVAHGHVADLIERNVDHLWLPNILSAGTRFMDNESHVCPWGQTLPYVIRQAPAFRSWAGRILCPTIRLREGPGALQKVLVGVATELGVARAEARRATTSTIPA